MTKKLPDKPRLTDVERHKRFVETGREIGASTKPKDFDEAFKAITAKGESKSP